MKCCNVICSFEGSTSAGTDHAVCCRLWDRCRAFVNVMVYRVHVVPKHAGSVLNPSRRPERYLREVTTRWGTQLSRSVAKFVIDKRTLHITSTIFNKSKVPVHAMKTYGVWRTAPLILHVVTTWASVVSYTLKLILSGERVPVFLWVRPCLQGKGKYYKQYS